MYRLIWHVSAPEVAPGANAPQGLESRRCLAVIFSNHDIIDYTCEIFTNAVPFYRLYSMTLLTTSYQHTYASEFRHLFSCSHSKTATSVDSFVGA